MPFGEAGFEWLARHPQGDVQGALPRWECAAGVQVRRGWNAVFRRRNYREGRRRPRTGAQTPGWSGEPPGRQRGSENNSPGGAGGQAQRPCRGPKEPVHAGAFRMHGLVSTPFSELHLLSLPGQPSSGCAADGLPWGSEGGGPALSLVSVATHPGQLPNDGTPDPPLSCRDESGHRRLGAG